MPSTRVIFRHGASRKGGMNTQRVRAAFAWSAGAIVALSVIAFPIVDSHLNSNYRGLGSLGSADLLTLVAGVKADPALSTTYGLPLAVRELAPGATLVVGTDDRGYVWPRFRLAALADLDAVVIVEGSTGDWAAGAEIEGNVAASMPAAGSNRGWQLVLDPGGENDTLVLIEQYGNVDVVISAALLPDFPAQGVAA